jgi:hypothetical protein
VETIAIDLKLYSRKCKQIWQCVVAVTNNGNKGNFCFQFTDVYFPNGCQYYYLIYHFNICFYIQDTSVLSPAVPFVITLYLIYYNYAYSKSNVFARAPCLFVFAFGFVLAKVSIVLLVSQTGDHPRSQSKGKSLGTRFESLHNTY